MMAVEEPLFTPAEQKFLKYAFALGCPEQTRDLLLSLARRVAYARFVHPEFGGAEAVLSEAVELKEAAGNARRVREEALDVMATCIRLANFESMAEWKS